MSIHLIMKECGDVYYYVKERLIKLSVLTSRNMRKAFTKRGVEGVTLKVVAGRGSEEGVIY
jgi:hypothetical protein